jgi:hypothetical protein
MSTQVHGPARAGRATRRAWIAVAFIPVAFVAAMVVGEGLFAMLGYESADEDAPAGAIALAGGAGILVFLIPCVVAWFLGRRAVAAGESQGRLPALLGALVGAMFVLMNLVGVVGRIAGF